jgi:hypothetical protein
MTISPELTERPRHYPRRVDREEERRRIYENGVFRPLEPVDLPEHQRVEVTIADEDDWLTVTTSSGPPAKCVRASA